MGRPLVAGLVFDQPERLLCEANIKYGFRIGPIGGKPEKSDKDFASAIKREFNEEYKMVVEPTEFIGTYPTESKGEGTFDVQMFQCRIKDVCPDAWKDGKPLSQEPNKSAFADWFSLEELNRLDQHGLLAPNLSFLLEIAQDNYREFELDDIHAEIPKTMTLLGLIRFMKEKMDSCLRQYEERKRKYGRSQFDMPPEFVLVNQSPEVARAAFNLSRALSAA